MFSLRLILAVFFGCVFRSALPAQVTFHKKADSLYAAYGLAVLPDSGYVLGGSWANCLRLLRLEESQAIGRFCGDVLRPRADSAGRRPCETDCPILRARSGAAEARAAETLCLADGSTRSTVIVSAAPVAGQQVQVLVPANTWQGTRLVEGGKYALLGTTVVPGFDNADFELGMRGDLISKFPHLAPEIAKFTREWQT